MLDNLLNPPILFFLGLIASLVRSDLEIPAPIPKFLALYLLMAIGLKGGAAVLLAGVVPLYMALATRVVGWWANGRFGIVSRSPAHVVMEVHMQTVKRIEIVVDALEADNLLRLLAQAGVGGYTLVRAVEDSGDRGPRHGDELTGVMQNSYLVVACPPHLEPAVIEAVRPVLKRFGGMCLVSDAQWVLH